MLKIDSFVSFQGSVPEDCAVQLQKAEISVTFTNHLVKVANSDDCLDGPTASLPGGKRSGSQPDNSHRNDVNLTGSYSVVSEPPVKQRGSPDQDKSIKDCQAAIIDELKAQLSKRAQVTANITMSLTLPADNSTARAQKNADGTGSKEAGSPLKPWQQELARQREAFKLAEPARIAAEKKENERVAAACAAEAQAAARLAAAAKEIAENAAAAVANLTLDKSGIPMPPPPPPPPGTLKSYRDAASQTVAVETRKSDSLVTIKLPASIFADILSKREQLANRAMNNHRADEELKPWQQALRKAQAEYVSSAPLRQAAEEKEALRVATARKAEADEKAQAAAEARSQAEKSARAAANLPRDANGIPLPPPPPAGAGFRP
ncbi:hypothetical protein [Izhakiella australiensis]|uniref:hypothetical protein n=1 Tax=Izhakiella australiensis TaxID=1926881 RepID=UPI0011159AE0|nr:hypothetical protein [Izhakiella australiensis]